MKVKIFTVGCSNGDGSATIQCFPSEVARSNYLDGEEDIDEDGGEYSHYGMPLTLDDTTIEIDIVDGFKNGFAKLAEGSNFNFGS